MNEDLQPLPLKDLSFSDGVCEGASVTPFTTAPRGQALWDRAETARDFVRLTQQAPLFHELATELAERAILPGARKCLDISRDAGVVASALLQRVPASASLCCVEPAAAMMRSGRQRLTDRRLAWVNAPETELTKVKGLEFFDVMVAHHLSIRAESLSETLLVAREALRPEGLLMFTLPGEFLGELLFRVSPEWVAFSRCVESVRQLAIASGEEAALPKVEECGAPPGTRDAEVSQEIFEEFLFNSGFEGVEVDRVDALVTAENHARRLGLPPNRDRWLSGVGPKRQAEAARLLRVRSRELPPLAQNWFVVRAKRCQNPQNTI